MKFLILGPLEVQLAAGEAGTSTAPAVRRLLALLLVHHDQVVATEQIADWLWPGRDAAKQSSALRFHLWKLRTVLEPDRPTRSDGSIIFKSGPGYVLRLGSHGLDSVEFKRGFLEASTKAADAPGDALQLLEGAFRLWRGAPLCDVQYEDFAQPEIRRLNALRYEAEALRMDLLLATNRNIEAAAELESLTERHPLSERMWGQLMTALYRAGRVGEALQVFDRARSALSNEIGIAPSSQLRDLRTVIARTARP